MNEDLKAMIEEFWQDLVDKDDRNSPAEYPDMCLITRKELAAIIEHVEQRASAVHLAGVLKVIAKMAEDWTDKAALNGLQSEGYLTLKGET